MNRYLLDEKGRGKNGFVQLAEAISPTLTATKSTGLGKQIASLESFNNPEIRSQIVANLNSNYQFMLSQLNAVSVESFDGAPSNSTMLKIQERNFQNRALAGAIAMEAYSDPIGYIQNRKVSTESADVVWDFTQGERAITLGIQPSVVSNESFEINNLNAAMPYSVAWNVACASQDEMTELYFSTLVMGPDQIGTIQEIRLASVYNGFKHRRVDEVLETDKRLLMDAFRDSQILRNEAIKIIPYYPEAFNSENEHWKEYFVDPKLVKATTVMVKNVPVPTAPLVFGKTINLLSISSHQGLLQGNVYDETDQLDAQLGIREIYLKVAEKAVRFNTQGLVRSQFTRPQEGHERDLILNFLADEFVLDKDTLDVTGAPIAAVKALADAGYSARLTVSIMGTANVHRAEITVNTPVIRVSKVTRNDTGEEVALTDSTVKGLVEALKLEGLGWYPKANRTNSNFRTQGPIIDTDAWTEKYVLGLRSPIMIQKPLGQEDRDVPALEDLITATRIRQTHDGMFELFNFRDQLREWVNRDANKHIAGAKRRIPNFIGLGKYVVTPFYEHIVFDFKKATNTTRSVYKLEDARAALMSCIQEAVARMYRDSNYFLALQIENNGKPSKPHVAIGTDPYLTMLLTLQGDTRLLGEAFDYTVAVSVVNEMTGKIMATFTRPDKKEFDYLSFGHTYYVPELVTTVTPFQQNGAIKQVTQVSPRYQHVPNLPILLEIDVINATELMQRLQELYMVSRTEVLEMEKAEAQRLEALKAALPKAASTAGEGAQPANSAQSQSGGASTPANQAGKPAGSQG